MRTYSSLKRYEFCRESHLALLIPYARQKVPHLLQLYGIVIKKL